jgi:hypothetical protein
MCSEDYLSTKLKLLVKVRSIEHIPHHQLPTGIPDLFLARHNKKFKTTGLSRPQQQCLYGGFQS